MWVLLSRFVNGREAVKRIELLPKWLDEYVRYKEPKELPEREFQSRIFYG